MTDEKTTGEPAGASGGSLAWIPVTERMPDRNANVLVWIPSGNDRTFIASLDEGGMWFSSDPTADAYSLGEDGAPTHWMPLPAPPADAK